MYEKHFGLRQRPFWPTPDSESYYPATSHEHALARLLQAIEGCEGMVLLTGQPGTGKTVLCHRLLERLGTDTVSAFLTNSHFGDRAGFLKAVLYELNQSYVGSEQELRLALTEFLLQNHQANKRTVVVIDEAHHLSADLLEELRLLGNLEARKSKAVQVVLIGQPTILETLNLPELAGCRQRLAVRVQIEPLPANEAADYIVHHLRTAGGQAERIIADEALELIARQTHGIPRLLNQAVHQAMLFACEAGARQVDAEAALDALAILGLEDDPESMPAEALQVMQEETEAAGEPAEEFNPTIATVGQGEDEHEPVRKLFNTPPRPAG